MEHTTTTRQWTTTKRAALALLALLLMLATTLLVTPATAIAQQPSPMPTPSPSPVEETDLVAQLTVECPENAGTLAGYQLVITGVEALIAEPLTDEDGNGVLTGTVTLPRHPPGPQPPPGTPGITISDVRIVAPDGSTVRQFGPVTLDRDEIILPATISFCDGGDGGNGDDGDGGSGSDGNGGSDGGGFLSGLLPETGGGWAVLLLIVGATLIGGGWLLVRRFSAS